MSGFTPGPWEVFRDVDCRYSYLPGIEGLNGELSIVVVGYPDDDSCGVQGRNADEAEANARLIAAAPELYEALRQLTSNASLASIHLPSEVDVLASALFDTLSQAERALAKARGEA